VRFGGPQHVKASEGAPAQAGALPRGTGAWRAGAFFWALVVLVASMLPPRDIAPAMPHFVNADKVAHVGSYAILGLLAVRGWSSRRWLGLAAVVLAFGALIEFVQPLTGRSKDMMDWLADAGGVLVGILAARVLGAVLGRK
jgi:VanZ family protein